MGIITISRGSYSRGKEIAEKLSGRLGYSCVSREILLKASEEFNVPEIKLTEAIQDAPSIFERIKHGKKRYVAFIRAAFLEEALKDNLVYHGFAGHFFTKDIPNVLKVRIIADLNYRIKVVMERDNINEEKARQILHKIDAERRKWSIHLYGVDTNTPELYDIVLRIDCLDVDVAVEVLFKMAKRSCFQCTPECREKLRDMLKEAQLSLSKLS